MFESLNQVLKGMKEHSLPLSVAANFALIALLIMALDGWSISHTEHGWAIRRVPPGTGRSPVQGRSRPGRRHAASSTRSGYYEISTSSSWRPKQSPGRWAGSTPGTSWCNDLRELSHKNMPPFEPRDRKVTLIVSASPQVARGEATVCENDAVRAGEQVHRVSRSDDENNGFYVEATRIRRCSRAAKHCRGQPGRLAHAGQLSGDVATDAERPRLSAPLHTERRADETTVVARSDG